MADDLRGLIERAGRFFHHRDVFALGHSGDRFRLDVFARAAGDVVDANRQLDCFGQRFEVLIKTFLRRLVVVGGDDQRRIGAVLGGEFRQPQRFPRAVASRCRA